MTNGDNVHGYMDNVATVWPATDEDNAVLQCLTLASNNQRFMKPTPVRPVDEVGSMMDGRFIDTCQREVQRQATLPTSCIAKLHVFRVCS